MTNAQIRRFILEVLQGGCMAAEELAEMDLANHQYQRDLVRYAAAIQWLQHARDPLDSDHQDPTPCSS